MQTGEGGGGGDEERGGDRGWVVHVRFRPHGVDLVSQHLVLPLHFAGKIVAFYGTLRSKHGIYFALEQYAGCLNLV